MLTVLLVILIIMLIGGLPVYPYSREWGYGPSLILTILLIFVLLRLLGVA